MVVGAFPGAHLTKTRPAVVLSSDAYHRHRPDVVVGVITSQIPTRLSPTDCELRFWSNAGLHAPSFFRLFLVTLPRHEVRRIGRLENTDWLAVSLCVSVGLGGSSARS